jgi:hypothetical protein
VFLPGMTAPILYEVNTRVWLRELSEQAGRTVTLADVPDSEIEQWQRLGFTHIWLMGVWQVGPKARDIALRIWEDNWRREIPSTADDVHGSPYAIQEYAVDVRLGDALSLLMLKERLGRAGLRLIIDFVPNHLGIDSTEPIRFPARFVHSSEPLPGTFAADARFGRRYFAHGRDPYFAPWLDTVQLDYRVQETHQAMTAVAQTASAYADGLRCDMAMLLLPEIFQATWKDFPSPGAHPTNANFWRKAISAVRQLQPQAEMIAEVYWDREEELQECGFDYTYNKRVYDYLMRGQDAELREFLQTRSPTFLRKSVHFLENHDEPRVAAQLSAERHKAAAALMLFLPGMALLHDGQLEGRRRFARIQVAKRPEEKTDPAIQAFYHELLGAIQRTHVRRGRAELLKNEGTVIAVKWQGPGREVDLALVNLGPDEQIVPCKDPAIDGDLRSSSVLYASKGASPKRSGDGVTVPGESAVVLRVRANGKG